MMSLFSTDFGPNGKKQEEDEILLLLLVAEEILLFVEPEDEEMDVGKFLFNIEVGDAGGESDDDEEENRPLPGR